MFEAAEANEWVVLQGKLFFGLYEVQNKVAHAYKTKSCNTKLCVLCLGREVKNLVGS